MGKSKQYRFWTNTDETDLTKFLDSQGNFSKFIKDLLDQYRLGNLTREDESDLKRKKLQVDINHKVLQSKLLEKQLLYYNTFEKTPSYQGKKAMKINVENQIEESPSCFDESNNRIMCPECGACFVFAQDQKDVGEAKVLFLDHYFQKHNSELPTKIQRELN